MASESTDPAEILAKAARLFQVAAAQVRGGVTASIMLAALKMDVDSLLKAAHAAGYAAGIEAAAARCDAFSDEENEKGPRPGDGSAYVLSAAADRIRQLSPSIEDPRRG